MRKGLIGKAFFALTRGFTKFYTPRILTGAFFMTKNEGETKRKIIWFPKFTTKNLAVMGILSAISFVLYMFAKFPLPFIFPSFLEMQFSDLPALLGSFSLGPFGGAVIILVKCLLKMPFSGTACVGELADIIVGLANVIPAGIYYQYNKSKKGAIISLIIGMFSATALSLIANRFILVPFFINEFGLSGIIGMVKTLYPKISEANFYSYYLPAGVLPFNMLRCLLCAILTYFTYKPLSKALHWEETSKKHNSTVAEEKEDDKKDLEENI